MWSRDIFVCYDALNVQQVVLIALKLCVNDQSCQQVEHGFTRPWKPIA